MHIKIDIKIFAIIILFWLTSQIEIYGIVMVSIILHEIGHLLAGVILKLKPKKIEVTPLGLSITFEGIGANFKGNIYLKKILIAIAGPLVNIILALLGLTILQDDIRYIFVYSNILLMLVNLIPIYPLDGGRILRIILHMKIGYFRACKLTNNISNIMIIILTISSSFLIFYLENISILLILIYLLLLNFQENKRYRLIKNTYNLINAHKNTITLEKTSL